MSQVLFVPADATRPAEARRVDQRDLAQLLGPGSVTFVGAVPDLGVVLVARADATRSNARFRDVETDGGDILGDVVCVATDADGEACDVGCEAFRAAHLRA